jgi:hypothetical protein
MLVPADDIVPYHPDTESEEVSEDSEGEDESDEESAVSTSLKRKSADPLEEHVLHPRFMTCLSCKEEFDGSKNERGECNWHPGNHNHHLLLANSYRRERCRL